MDISMDYLSIKTYIDIFSALLAPVLGVGATTILILQYNLARWRWKLELYNKRYPVYLNTMGFISNITSGTGNNDQLLFTFLREARDKEFLFGKEIQEFLIELYKKGNELDTHQKVYKDLPVGEERSRRVDKAGEIKKWFPEQYDTAKKLFAEYLKIDKK